MRAVLLDRATLGDDVNLSAFPDHNLEWTVYEKTTPEQLAARIEDADIILTNKVVLGDQEMAAARKLKYIGILATGTNNVDLVAAGNRAITVTNVTAYGTAAVAQHTFALMLALATALPRYSQLSRDGTWARSDMFCLIDSPVMELSGKTLLIVGYGELGRAVARLGEAFGMNIQVAATPGSPTKDDSRIPLEQGLRTADVVSLHCPLTDSTRNLINRERLALMPPHALLINTARGGLVDEQALVDALHNNRLGGAGFDVLTEEPPVNGNPLLNYDQPNLIITPHTAWLARESRQRLLDIAAGNLSSFLKEGLSSPRI